MSENAMNFKQIFLALNRFFQTEDIAYALIGAFALKAYGYVRATQDVDFIVPAEEQNKVISFLESLGYETIYRSHGYSNHTHPISKLGRIDFIYVRGNTAKHIFGASETIALLDDIKIPVASAEHIAALKIFAMKCNPKRRFREMDDILKLVQVIPLDPLALRDYFMRYDQMDAYDELFGKIES